MRLTAFIALATLSVVACKPPTPSYTVTDPKTGEKTKISVDAKGDNSTITVNTKDGAGTISVAQEGEAPKNLPSYVPLYPGAKYLGSFAAASDKSSEGGPVAGGMVTFSTTDPSAKVLAFYKEAFTKAGLKEQASGDMGGMAMLSFSKGENEQEGAQVMATPAPSGGTQVQVMYSAAP
jgi:predicted enzyme related to lactoylglutathione lyase